MFESMYEIRADERTPYKENWCGPEHFEHAVPTLIARYKASKESDGQTAEVYCTAMPARFYDVKALQDKNSIDITIDPWTLSTGSGHEMAVLAAEIAKQTAEGMISVNKE